MLRENKNKKGGGQLKLPVAMLLTVETAMMVEGVNMDHIFLHRF
ncbi:hypothetical protein [Fodinibius salicampi]|nr:hypothetical protein [Fodinibius salicampi]